jgi:diguanylate cyclase (GGDEF)-like protein/PAS domain S-box-containing protein
MSKDEQSILKKQTALLYQQALFSNATVIVAAILMYSLFAEHAFSSMLLAWSVAISLLAGLRLLLLYTYKRVSRHGEIKPEKWLWAYTMLTFLVGLIWGGSSIFYVLIDDIQISTLFYVLISTVVAAAVPVLAAWFPAFLAYTVPQVIMLTSMSFYQIQTTPVTKLMYFLTFAFIAYSLLMVSLAKRANMNIVQGLRLQQKNQHLLDKLNREVNQREALVQARTEELVEANQKLKSSQAHMLKLSRAVESSPNAILITDAEGYIEYINRKGERVSGYRSEEVLGNRLDKYIGVQDATDKTQPFADIWATVSQKGQWRGEIKNRRKDGEDYWIRIYLAAVYDDEKVITHYVVIYEDITDSRRLSQKLSYQATHDDLTGLINRAEFERQLTALVEDAIQNHTEHALCFLDLDQFKVINDTCGHIAGDELLRQLGGLLGSITRKVDTLARLGGDEFAILIANCQQQQAENIANKVRELVEQFQFVWESQIFTIGVSIGVTSINHRTRTRTEALKQADSACYAAKNAGRNRVYVYQDQDKRLAEQEGEFKWVNELKEALLDDRLELFVQPIVSTRSANNLRHYEVLVRLRDKRGQLFSPGAFLPSAERYNLSERVDRWVIDHVFDWLEANKGRLNFVRQLAVNLSGASIGSTEMLGHISARLAKANFEPGMIKFEITETAAITNLRNANVFIEALSERGCTFSLDDFGSGLSSFAYLKNLPVQSIKIDGMFVRDINRDPLDFEMVKSINDIGHVMGLETIAEFVEDEQIWERLKSIGVDYGQGYYLGRPQPISDLFDRVGESESQSHMART